MFSFVETTVQGNNTISRRKEEEEELVVQGHIQEEGKALLQPSEDDDYDDIDMDRNVGLMIHDLVYSTPQSVSTTATSQLHHPLSNRSTSSVLEYSDNSDDDHHQGGALLLRSNGVGGDPGQHRRHHHHHYNHQLNNNNNNINGGTINNNTMMNEVSQMTARSSSTLSSGSSLFFGASNNFINTNTNTNNDSSNNSDENENNNIGLPLIPGAHCDNKGKRQQAFLRNETSTTATTLATLQESSVPTFLPERQEQAPTRSGPPTPPPPPPPPALPQPPTSQLTNQPASFLTSEQGAGGVAPSVPGQQLFGRKNSFRVISSAGQQDDDEGEDEQQQQQQQEKQQRQSTRSGRRGAGRKTRHRYSRSQNWMTQLAYSFRSPAPSNIHRKKPNLDDVITTTANQQQEQQQQKQQQSAGDGGRPAGGYVARRSSSRVYANGGNGSALGLLGGGAYHFQMEKQRQQQHQHLNMQQHPRLHRGEMTPLLLQTPNPDDSPRYAGSTPGTRVEGRGYRGSVLHPRRGRNYVAIAAAFLQDYERNRPPSLPCSINETTSKHIALYRLKYSGIAYRLVLIAAAGAFFLSSTFEGFDDHVLEDGHLRMSRYFTAALNFFGLVVFCIDMRILQEFKVDGGYHYHRDRAIKIAPTTTAVASRTEERLVKPMGVFLALVGFETLIRLWMTDGRMVMFSSVLKPLVLFYVSSRARDALEALQKISGIVLRVLVVELLLILMFAAVACRLFYDYDQFSGLAGSWLSLFELSTTVVNPSLWMPMYKNSRSTAMFFVIFVITSVFFFHSLLLSVVFNTYVQAATEVHQRSDTDREEAIRLAHVALQLQQRRILQQHHNRHKHVVNGEEARGNGPSPGSAHYNDGEIDVRLVRQTLRLVRPHYNAMKINALVEIVAGRHNARTVDFSTFRTRIRHALNASVRTARNATTLSIVVELVAVVLAVVNFVYVILVSSSFSSGWFDPYQVIIGCIITIIAIFELAVRFNPLRIPDYTPITRLNTTFDGLALFAAIMSCFGIVLYIAKRPMELEYILMGRAVDMIRVMRFFQMFRDIVRRSSDVIPALVGPIILVLTAIHLFVYLGMALWGGAVEVGAQMGKITHLYDLNNFNSYQEGVVTLFQVLVVNDWHAIAEVFLYANRNNHPVVVYLFFVLGNLICVSIMLNLLTAFFVESFVTKLHDSGDDVDGPPVDASFDRGVAGGSVVAAPVKRDRDHHSNIQTSENSSIRRISRNRSYSPIEFAAQMEEDGHGNDRNSDNNDNSDNMINGAHARTNGGGLTLPDRIDEVDLRDSDVDSLCSTESELFEFDVYEREGFDKIMQTIAGSTSNGDFARQVCRFLGIFESLSPGRERVGYLVCDQHTSERFGSGRFRSMSVGYLEESELHLIVSDMHAELLALASNSSFQDRALVRRFRRHTKVGATSGGGTKRVVDHVPDDSHAATLEISATLLRLNPALSLFVSREGTLPRSLSENEVVNVAHSNPATDTRAY